MVNNKEETEAKARAAEKLGACVGSAAGAAGLTALAQTTGASLVSAVAASNGTAAGITGLIAGVKGVSVGTALLLTNPVTAAAAAGIGAAVGGYLAFKAVRKILRR